MDKELKAKWVDALRSGDYKQGKFYLYDRSKNAHCCLGVLGCLVGQRLETMDGMGDLSTSAYDFLRDLLDERDMKVLAYSMNDVGRSFTEIADHIESRL